MKDHAVDVVLEHLKTYIANKDRQHSCMLQNKIYRLEKALLKTRKYYCDIKCAMKKGMHLMDDSLNIDGEKIGILDTPETNDHKSGHGAIEK